MTLIAICALGLTGCAEDATGADGSGGAEGTDSTAGDGDGDMDAGTSGGDGDGDMAACPDDVFLDVSQSPGAGPGYPAPILEVACSDTELIVNSNTIPHYTFVPITPNALVEANVEYRVTLFPEVAPAPTEIPLLGVVGFAVNGLPFFGANEGAFPDPYGDPVYNDIMDECLGHTANTYHYHALVQQCLVQAGLVAEPWLNGDPDPTQASPVVGFAMDGFPVYGSYGCADADCSGVVEYQSGWVQVGDPSTYAWDNYEYMASAEPTVLDQCNGHVGPSGDYHYHATTGFPYILGCYAGTPANGAGGDGGGGDDGGMNPGDPPPCAPGQTSMCCGDGVCDGPETVDNCAEDCA